MNADSEAEIRDRLADDPWLRTEQIRTVSAEPWKLLVGEDAIPMPAVAPR